MGINKTVMDLSKNFWGEGERSKPLQVHAGCERGAQSTASGLQQGYGGAAPGKVFFKCL